MIKCITVSFFCYQEKSQSIRFQEESFPRMDRLPSLPRMRLTPISRGFAYGNINKVVLAFIFLNKKRMIFQSCFYKNDIKLKKMSLIKSYIQTRWSSLAFGLTCGLF